MKTLGVLVLAAASMLCLVHGARGILRRRMVTRTGTLEGRAATMLGVVFVSFGMALVALTVVAAMRL